MKPRKEPWARLPSLLWFWKFAVHWIVPRDIERILPQRHQRGETLKMIKIGQREDGIRVR